MGGGLEDVIWGIERNPTWFLGVLKEFISEWVSQSFLHACAEGLPLLAGTNQSLAKHVTSHNSLPQGLSLNNKLPVDSSDPCSRFSFCFGLQSKQQAPTMAPHPSDPRTSRVFSKKDTMFCTLVHFAWMLGL